jgi:hypothetical protein
MKQKGEANPTHFLHFLEFTDFQSDTKYSKIFDIFLQKLWGIVGNFYYLCSQDIIIISTHEIFG